MAAKMDKTKLAHAIMGVGSARITGVEKGAQVNGKTPAPEAEGQADAAPKAEAGQGTAAPAPARESEGKTDRIAFLCSPKEKKQLKQLALDSDMNVSVLIREALIAKGYLK